MSVVAKCNCGVEFRFCQECCDADLAVCPWCDETLAPWYSIFEGEEEIVVCEHTYKKEQHNE